MIYFCAAHLSFASNPSFPGSRRGFHHRVWHRWEYPSSFCFLFTFFLSFPLTPLSLSIILVYRSSFYIPISGVYLSDSISFHLIFLLFALISNFPFALRFEKVMICTDLQPVYLIPCLLASFLLHSLAEADWFSSLFFPAWFPPQLYYFLHGFIALEVAERLPGDPQDLTGGPFSAPKG